MFWTRSLVNISAHATPENLSVEVWIGRQADRTISTKEKIVLLQRLHHAVLLNKDKSQKIVNLENFFTLLFT